jgi:hypothetical protein
MDLETTRILEDTIISVSQVQSARLLYSEYLTSTLNILYCMDTVYSFVVGNVVVRPRGSSRIYSG